MIIAERYGFAFIHIPKCAGSSVRQQIEAYDDEAGFFARVKPHPVLGRADYGHFTLAQLRAYFPGHIERLQKLETYAIVRDPLQRFGSALRQTLWMYDKRPMTLIPPAELRDAVRRIIDEIDADFEQLPHQHVFFTPQRDYVYEGDTRFVRYVFPIEATDRFIAAISERVGAPLDAGRRANQNVELRVKALGPALFRVNDLLRWAMPRVAHDRLKRAALSVVARKESAAEASGVTEMPEVRDFVRARYAADAALHRAANAALPDPAAA